MTGLRAAVPLLRIMFADLLPQIDAHIRLASSSAPALLHPDSTLHYKARVPYEEPKLDV